MSHDIKSLRDALQIFSKSSPQAIEVERKVGSEDIYKQYLYIETPIEADFRERLEALKSGEILFLCGSSGDGKSAILTRYSRKYANRVTFHLDATHSFDPHQDAISTLDQLFKKDKESSVPLVVGINIGMMGNYAEGGSFENDDIKESMRSYLAGSRGAENHFFLYFEDYSKFQFGEEGPLSDFAKSIMQRLTAGQENPFFALFKEDVRIQNDAKLQANFRLLTLDSVQNVVVDALLKARLVKDQFMTARSLLDFLYHLLTGPGYIFDNLFSTSDNDLLQRMAFFDPSALRTKRIDQFILQLDLGLVEDGFKLFKERLEDFGISGLDNPASYIRLFYLLRQTDDFVDNYHLIFKEDFSNSLVDYYSVAWNLHTSFDGDKAKQIKLQKQFYSDILLNAVRHYMNRNASGLKKRQYFIADYNDCTMAASLDLKPDFVAIKNDTSNRLGVFNAYLKIEDSTLSKIPININLLDLMIKLNHGYRPNKHDKNTVVILDELVDEIVRVANQSSNLLIFDGDDSYEISNQDDEIFEVSGV